MILPLIAQLGAAQEAANLSNNAVARAIGAAPSTVGRYRNGLAEPSLHNAVAWAEACGARLVVLREAAAQVAGLTSLAEELTPDELGRLEAAAQALLSSRRSPERRAVVLAGMGLAADQREDLATRRASG